VSAEAQTRELLLWIDARPRTYAEAIEAWKTSCPRLSVWDDALTAGLVEVSRDGDGSWVSVTPRGRAVLSADAAR
jgi:hypothetical protein